MIPQTKRRVSAVALLASGALCFVTCLAVPIMTPHSDNSTTVNVSSTESEKASIEEPDQLPIESAVPDEPVSDIVIEEPDESTLISDTETSDAYNEMISDVTTIPEAPPAPVPEVIPEPIPEPEPEPQPEPEVKPEVKPNIIKLNVKLYNDAGTRFNKTDGQQYCQDIAQLLQKHAPEGLHISAGVAMAYTEGGAGKTGVYTKTNNCFGMRASSSWDGYVYSRTTGKVYKNWKTAAKYGATKDVFRAYDSMEDSVKDYCELISSARYKKCLTIESNKKYLSYILSRGYGSSSLLDTWLYIINLYDLEQYDVSADPEGSL